MSRRLKIEDTIIPKIIRDNTNIFQFKPYKHLKPTYKNLQLILTSSGYKIECATLQKLFERITVFLKRTSEENYKMIFHLEKFEELEGLDYRELEELMVISIDLGFPLALLHWIASDIGRTSGTDKYHSSSIETFKKKVYEYVKSLPEESFKTPKK